MDARSKELRKNILAMVSVGKRGHIGPAGSIMEILRVLYDSWLSFRPNDPNWLNRDRFILSKGHGCLALYSILVDKGFFERSELETFCQSGSLLGGHPEIKIPGVEASTGALGHGLSIGIGRAIGLKMRRSSSRVVVLVGDGEINEGAIWEGILSARKHELSNLTVLVDYNKMQSFGPTNEVIDLEPLGAKWESFGCAVQEVDGHSVSELEKVLSTAPFLPDRPSVIICHTVKGKGFSMAERNASWHHKSRISAEELIDLYAGLD